MKFKIINSHKVTPAIIKVIGIGGGGGNAVNRMVISRVKGIQFISANTDADALKKSLAETKVQLGPKLTKGLGSGAKPEVGKNATEESADTIQQLLQGTDMLFVTAGMGGGTGTGGSPVVARIAKSLGILTVGVVTKPFMWEGKTKMAIAEQGISELKQYCDALIEIPNQRLSTLSDNKTLAVKSYEKADDVLKRAVQSISDVITTYGEINVDFQDVKTVMQNSGKAILGFGEASGEDRAIIATDMAITSPLLENEFISGAKGVLVNITGSRNDLKMAEIDAAMEMIHGEMSPDAQLIYGQVYEDELNGKIKITVIATGFSGSEKQEKSVDGRYSREEDLGRSDDLSIPAWMRRKSKVKKHF